MMMMTVMMMMMMMMMMMTRMLRKASLDKLLEAFRSPFISASVSI